MSDLDASLAELGAVNPQSGGSIADLSSQQKAFKTSDLEITPTQLEFRFELRKDIPVTVSLHNAGPDKVAFKFRTTAPKKYCVRPSSGMVKPGATKDVQIIRQAQRVYPPSQEICKDKFLVQTEKVAFDGYDVPPELWAETGSSTEKQFKIPVVLVGLPNSRSPMTEGDSPWCQVLAVKPLLPCTPVVMQLCTV